LVDILGYLGGLLTTFCYLPQIIRVFRLKSAREISTSFTVLLLTGIIIWLIYGIWLNIVPIIVWNIFAIGIVGTLLYAKLRFGHK
jgi:MtN3 and saliva related transmembrane protein